jgi:hypothetical protein
MYTSSCQVTESLISHCDKVGLPKCEIPSQQKSWCAPPEEEGVPTKEAKGQGEAEDGRGNEKVGTSGRHRGKVCPRQQ